MFNAHANQLGDEFFALFNRLKDAGFPEDLALELPTVMRQLRASRGRLYGPVYEGVLEMDPVDPREALDTLGTILLDRQHLDPGRSPWQVRRKTHPDLTGPPGRFCLLLYRSYQWMPGPPHVPLGAAQLDALLSAQMSDAGDRLEVRFAVQDEWAWTFAASRFEAEESWKNLMKELAPLGSVRDVVHAPLWPPPGPHRVPYLAARPYWTHARTMMGHNRLPEALASYDQALGIHPYDPASLCNRATCRCLLGDPAAAIEDVNRAMAIEPGVAVHYLNRSLYLRQLQRYEEALAAAEVAVRLAPADSVVFICRGRALEGLGRLDAARADFRKALLLNPQDPQAIAELARLGG